MAVKSLKRAQEKIEIKDLKLNALLDVSLAINDNLSREDLFNIFQNTLAKLKIEKLALFIFNEQWTNALSCGVKNIIDIDVERELIQFTEISEVNFKSNQALSAFDLVIPVYHQTKAIAYLLIGDAVEANGVSPLIKHLNFIQTFTNIIVVAIENQRLAQQAILQERTKKELELASEMQSMLLPTKFPVTPGIAFAGYYKSHQKVGGDYYDIVKVNENEWAFCIADVSGKGISAAILMSNFQANMRAVIQYQKNLKDVVSILNQKVNESAKGERFITFFIGIFNIQNKELQYINCGHNPPILKQNNHLQILQKGTVGLGMLDDLPFLNEEKITIESNSSLLAYTDGLTEVENENNEEFGENRVFELLQNNNFAQPQLLINLLNYKLEQFKNNQPMMDDIAMLAVQFN
ncbi:MAG: Phosphoserine phosphatase RsbU [Bacteroidota bacterium]|jgi:sigma-B regulation protein RsbU (phosphoserine phosphatase)